MVHGNMLAQAWLSAGLYPTCEFSTPSALLPRVTADRLCALFMHLSCASLCCSLTAVHAEPRQHCFQAP